MIATDLLGLEVFGPRFVGYVSDLRFVLDESSSDQPTPTARLYGLVVSPHARSTSLGFERSGVGSPWPIAALVGWRHRGSFLVWWADIARIEPPRVQLRPDYTKWSPYLSESAAFTPDFE
jgi:hypothetical protein